MKMKQMAVLAAAVMVAAVAADPAMAGVGGCRIPGVGGCGPGGDLLSAYELPATPTYVEGIADVFSPQLSAVMKVLLKNKNETGLVTTTGDGTIQGVGGCRIPGVGGCGPGTGF